MKIYLASDHAGFELKKALIEYLKTKGLDVEDMGPYEFDRDDDYPDFIYPCALRVAESRSQGKLDIVGIVIGASGQGEAIVANKVKGVRAALYYGGNLDIVRKSKTHNNANMLSLGANFISEKEATEAVDLWLNTRFSSEERHERRIRKITNIDNHD